MMTAAEAYYSILDMYSKQTIDLVLHIIKQAVDENRLSVDLLNEDTFCDWSIEHHWNHVLQLLGYTVEPIYRTENKYDIYNEVNEIVGYKISW